MTYTSLNSLLYITKLVSRGHIQPPDADLQEYWTWKPQGGHAPWFIRAAQGGKFWGQQEEERADKTDAVSVGSLVRASEDKNGGSSRLESRESHKLDTIMVREGY